MARQNLIQFRDSELKALLERFCVRTNREAGPTLRAIVRLFFADGEQVASQRLNTGLWDARQAGEPASRVKGLAQRVRARAAARESGRSAKPGRKPAG